MDNQWAADVALRSMGLLGYENFYRTVLSKDLESMYEVAGEVIDMHWGCIHKIVRLDACVTFDANMCTTMLSGTTVFEQALRWACSNSALVNCRCPLGNSIDNDEQVFKVGYEPAAALRLGFWCRQS